MLNLQAVNHFYGNQHSLWNVDLVLRPGECIGVLGREGMGKTTTVNCIAGHLPVASGRMTGMTLAPRRRISPLSAQSRSAIGIGYVPQDKRIFPNSAWKRTCTSPAAGKPGANASGGEIYEHFPELYALRQRKGASLSDDDQYQLALAVALIVQPRLLILMNPRAAEAALPAKAGGSAAAVKSRYRPDGAARRAAPALYPPGGGSLLCLAPGP